MSAPNRGADDASRWWEFPIDTLSALELRVQDTANV